MVQVVAHHAARGGPAVRAKLTTGEVVATVSNDAMRAGGAFDITARLAGAIASYFVVAIILLSSSSVLGLVVLVGVPVLVLSLSFVIRPLQARQRDQREEVGRLTALGADTVSGLRVLRGIGGEQVFLARYRSRSEQVRRAGVRVALPQSTLDSAQVLLPGIFVVIVTWLGARLAVEGTISPGELVAFYGYAAFLVIPLRTAAETVDKVTRAYVGANRMLEILRIEPQVAEPSAPAVEPPPGYRSPTGAPASSSSRGCSPASSPRCRRKASSSSTGSAASSTTTACCSAAFRSSRCRSRPCGGGSWSVRPTRCSSPARCRRSSTPGRARPRHRCWRRSRWRTRRTCSTRCPKGSPGSSRSADARSRGVSVSGSS